MAVSTQSFHLSLRFIREELIFIFSSRSCLFFLLVLHSLRIHRAVRFICEIHILIYQRRDVYSKSADDEGYQKDDHQPERGFSIRMVVPGTSLASLSVIRFNLSCIHNKKSQNDLSGADNLGA